MASFMALFLSSSLYLVAALEVYFVLGSLLLSAALPPLDWKNFVADSLPPTFMIRSWSHCHSVRRVSPLLVRKGGGGEHTVKVRGSHERDVDTEVTMVRGAVEAEIDS